MSRNEIDEEQLLIFIRAALQVSTDNYEAIVQQRSAGTRQKAAAKIRRLEIEIADFHAQLGELMKSNRE